MTAKKCIYCGAKAELLCDHHLGFERLRSQMAKDTPNLVLLASWSVPLRYRKLHTCDAALCQACAVNSGVMHFRLRYSGYFFDTIDRCPGHDSFGTIAREITGLEADAMRSSWRRSIGCTRRKQEPSQIDLFQRAPS